MDTPDEPCDPTIVGRDPILDGVESRVRAVSPDLFGGMHCLGNVISVGLTRDIDRRLADLQAAFPEAEIHAFAARYSWDELIEIKEEISELLESAANSSGALLSVGADEVRNAVEVGVTDPTSPEAKAIEAKYGTAVYVFKDEPIDRI